MAQSAAAACYLEVVSSDGGGAPQTRVVAVSDDVEKLEELKELYYRSLLCNRVANRFYGAKTGKLYFKFMPCLRWWCDDCGKRGGRINIKRMKRVLEHIDPDPEKVFLRQAVFTVPASDAPAFMSRAGLNALIRMAEKIIRKRFPGLPSVAVLHLFGDKGGVRFHPHVHIITLAPLSSPTMLPLEDIQQMREAWRFALQAYLRHPVTTVNFHISYAKGQTKMRHRVRYLTRPMPGPHQYHDMKKDLDLLYFCAVVMKGFIFVRYFNGSRLKGIADPTEKDEIDESQTLAGESLIFVLHGQITREQFNEQYGAGDTEELSPGFYRVNTS